MRIRGKNLRGKDSKKAGFYDSIYFDLLDAMEEKVCPVCFLIQKSESRYMDTLFYELVNDPGVREKLRKSYGFCTRHAQLAKKVGKPLAIAIIYEDICSTLVKKLQKEEAPPFGGKKCPACELTEEAENRYLKSFVKNFPKEDFQKHYERSFGLCTNHFLLVYTKLNTPEEKKLLKQYQLNSLQKYLPELEEFIRKHDYRFSHEGFDKEATSWKRIVDKVAGNYQG